MFKDFFAFLEKQFLTVKMVKFLKFCSEHSIDVFVFKFREILPTEIGEIVRCLLVHWSLSRCLDVYTVTANFHCRNSEASKRQK